VRQDLSKLQSAGIKYLREIKDEEITKGQNTQSVNGSPDGYRHLRY
jgi:hypothetical protein